MKTNLLLILAAMLTTTLSAQRLKKITELKIPREGGANGASVAWHPVQKKYYAAMAGNVEFPLCVFDITGKRVSPEEQKALFDVRGLWYNPTTKALQMNGYNDFGWGEYKLNSQGLPTDVEVLHADMNQPGEQCAGAFNAKDKLVYFLNSDGDVEAYNHGEAIFKETISLHLGRTKEDGEGTNADVLEDYNLTTVVFTGTKGAELGLLNHTNHEIELYNIADGYVTKKLKLPDSAPVTDWLNFSYCNGVYWLFDKTARIWKGYK